VANPATLMPGGMFLMCRTFACFLSLVLSPLSLVAGQPVVHAIRCTGNSAVAEQEIISCMTTSTGTRLSFPTLARDRESILRIYHERGYYFSDVRITPEYAGTESVSVTIVIDIHEGEPYTIGTISLAGNIHLPTAQILSDFETHVDGTLETAALERDFSKLLEKYERIGYPFAGVTVGEIRIVGDSLHRALELSLAIDEGTLVMIDEVRVAGNTETKSDVIVREARIALHEPYDQEKVGKIPGRLNRMNIFTSVKEPQVFVGENGGGLLLAVEEGNANTFDGVLGYAPTPGGGGGNLSGIVDVTFGNLFGTARKLNVRWSRDASESQEIMLRYIEPWAFGLPLDLGGMFHQREQDSLYVRRAFEMNANLLVTESFSIGGVLTNETIIPSSTVVFQPVSSSRTLSLGMEMRYDTRDDAVSPTHGVDYRTRYQFGTKHISGTAIGSDANDAAVKKLSLDVEGYEQVFDRQVAAVGIHGRQTTSGRLELGDLYRFGGTNTLRGYRENAFIGSRVAWMNNEYRFLLARHSYFYGFVDLGYAELAADETRQSGAETQFKVGYGIGIRLDTALGNIGVSFALGQGDSFTDGKIHFGLMNQF